MFNLRRFLTLLFASAAVANNNAMSLPEACAIMEADGKDLYPQIKTKFRAQALTTHPDKTTTSDLPGNAKANEEMSKLNEAHSLFKSLEKNNKNAQHCDFLSDEKLSKDNAQYEKQFSSRFPNEITLVKHGEDRYWVNSQDTAKKIYNLKEAYQEREKRTNDARDKHGDILNQESPYELVNDRTYAMESIRQAPSSFMYACYLLRDQRSFCWDAILHTDGRAMLYMKELSSGLALNAISEIPRATRFFLPPHLMNDISFQWRLEEMEENQEYKRIKEGSKNINKWMEENRGIVGGIASAAIIYSTLKQMEKTKPYILCLEVCVQYSFTIVAFILFGMKLNAVDADADHRTGNGPGM